MKLHRRFVASAAALATLATMGVSASAFAEEAAVANGVPAGETFPAGTAFKPLDADPALAAELTGLDYAAKFKEGEYNLRIPALAVASNGDLLVSYDYRPKDGGNNGGDPPNANSLMQVRSTDGGRSWEEPTVIAEGRKGDPEHRKAYAGASYVVDHGTGTIFDFYDYSQAIGAASNAAAVIKAAKTAGVAADPNDIIVPAYTYKADGSIDETATNAMNIGVAVSEDNGHTWSQRLITNEVLADIVRDPSTGSSIFQSCFTAPGAGTQKMQEPYKGRLLQQLTCMADIPENNDINPDNDKTPRVVALTIYSDDHGVTWHAGNPTATTYDGQVWRFDENKVVELSDGTLLMNSRTWKDTAANDRIIAISKDGGVNWGDYRYTAPYLVDPGNNAQTIRAYPNARPGTLRSKVLLHSYTNSTSGANEWNDRIHGTIAMSLDDGKTWPISREFREGGTGYTTIAVLPSGAIGIVMEPDSDGWNSAGFQTFTMGWLDPGMSTELAIAPAASTHVSVGARVSIPLNMVHNDPTLTDTVKFSGLPEGFVYNEATQAIEGTLDSSVADGTYRGTVSVAEADDGTGRPRSATSSFDVVVGEPGSDTAATPAVEGKRSSVKRDALADTGAVASVPAVAAAAMSLLGLALLVRRARMWR